MSHTRNLVPKLAIHPVSVNESNIEILKHLDLKLFPVRYKDDYYYDLTQNNNKYSFLFMYNGKYVGEASYELYPTSQRCYLMTIGVLKKYRSKGLGSQMLNFVENMVRSKYIRMIYLHVQLKNFRASRFYLKYNYRVLRIEKNYYSKLENQSAVVLCKYF